MCSINQINSDIHAPVKIVMHFACHFALAITVTVFSSLAISAPSLNHASSFDFLLESSDYEQEDRPITPLSDLTTDSFDNPDTVEMISSRHSMELETYSEAAVQALSYFITQIPEIEIDSAKLVPSSALDDLNFFALNRKVFQLEIHPKGIAQRTTVPAVTVIQKYPHKKKDVGTAYSLTELFRRNNFLPSLVDTFPTQLFVRVEEADLVCTNFDSNMTLVLRGQIRGVRVYQLKAGIVKYTNLRDNQQFHFQVCAFNNEGNLKEDCKHYADPGYVTCCEECTGDEPSGALFHFEEQQNDKK